MSVYLSIGCKTCRKKWFDSFSTHTRSNINGHHEGAIYWMVDHEKKCKDAAFVLLWEDYNFNDDNEYLTDENEC